MNDLPGDEVVEKVVVTRWRYSSWRTIIYVTQCRLFSVAQWLRTTGSGRPAIMTSDVR
jgi:hypothetical protein